MASGVGSGGQSAPGRVIGASFPALVHRTTDAFTRRCRDPRHLRSPRKGRRARCSYVLPGVTGSEPRRDLDSSMETGRCLVWEPKTCGGDGVHASVRHLFF